MKTTKELYDKVIDYAENDIKSDNFTGFYTPVFERLYNLVRGGVKVDTNKIVKAFRYGNVPENGLSYNYRDNECENGTSVARIDGKNEINGINIKYSLLFSDRKEVEVTGILMPLYGSDGENLVLPFGIEQFDF